MAYQSFNDSQSSAQTAEERGMEAERILEMLEDHGGEFTASEARFITDISERMCGGEEVSPKQLWWLRDIKDKYL